MDGYNTNGHSIYDVKYHVLKGEVVILISCPPSITPSELVQYLKGRLSRLRNEFQSWLK